MSTSLGEALDALADTIADRAEKGAAGTSYTVELLAAGVARCAKKFGEEATEAVIAAATGENLAAEAADVLYHLLVMLKAGDVAPADVAAELEKRRGKSGLEEKAGR
ncbi:MAG TPA: phosphoribosyl-ATP diphosphatase [Caulobacterales bacterium]|jgi:phosphoribosyl-ATP pyrophosphohydrolase|nr:phosphoribosyl-ATP diphosphatase [Caulobacterales bacterium]